MILVWLLLAGAYVVSARLGFSMAFLAEQVTVVWAPAGISLAALLLLGYRAWPGVALGAFIANVTANEPVLTALVIAMGNTAEALIGAYLLRHVSDIDFRLGRFRDVLGLIFFSAIASPIISATIGVISLCMSGLQPWDAYGTLWRVWWLGDATGILLIAPALLVWLGQREPLLRDKVAQLLLLTLLLAAVCLSVFTQPSPIGVDGHSFVYAIFPFIIFSSLYFGQRGTTLVTLIASAFAIWATMHGVGPFVTGSVHYSLIMLQLFMASVAVTGLVLSAAIREQRRAEELLQSGKQRLQAVIDSARDAIVTVDAQGRVLEWNHHAQITFGWSRAEALNRPLGDLILPRQEEESCLDMLTHAVHECVEMEALDRHGRIIYVEATAMLRQSEDDPYLTVFFRDIAQRRQVAETQARLAAIVAYSEDAIIGKNLDGIINFWNAGAERLFGYTSDEAVGRSITMVIPRDRLSEEWHIQDRLRRGEKIEHYETIRVTKSGRMIHISLSVSPIRDEKGKIIGASKVARDISQQKRVEEALRDADRRKDEFLAMLAHELRNPLAPLSNALHILQMSRATQAQRDEAFSIMKRQLHQIVRLVDDLMDVSRITHGKIELRQDRMQFDDAIRDAIETTRPLMEANRHELTVNLPSQPVWLHADHARLAQVFANLLNNAAKYTLPGGKVWLEGDIEGQQLVVRVRDSGIGIDADVLPKIFDPFTQADNSIDRARGGLGIGLMLVKTLVRMHGGEIRAYSRGPGQGSEFTVRLPITEAASVENSAASSSVRSQQPTHRLRILVAEDSEALARTLGWMIELLGHEVRLVHDGLSAIATAKEYRPDVIILDIGLPGMSGYDVCSQMRTDPSLRHATIIAQTGWGMKEHRERSKAAGFDHHLVKPVDVETLERMLNSLSPLPKAA